MWSLTLEFRNYIRDLIEIGYMGHKHYIRFHFRKVSLPRLTEHTSWVSGIQRNQTFIENWKGMGNPAR